jgi:hypothetical protein
MNLGRRTLLVDDDDWAKLQGLASRLVHDSEMSVSANRSAGRVSAMLRLIARGELVVVRPGEQEQEQVG